MLTLAEARLIQVARDTANLRMNAKLYDIEGEKLVADFSKVGEFARVSGGPTGNHVQYGGLRRRSDQT